MFLTVLVMVSYKVQKLRKVKQSRCSIARGRRRKADVAFLQLSQSTASDRLLRVKDTRRSQGPTSNGRRALMRTDKVIKFDDGEIKRIQDVYLK